MDFIHIAFGDFDRSDSDKIDLLLKAEDKLTLDGQRIYKEYKASFT